ncbi:MAG TPA: FG-GAP-like repeat-containing protein [Crocinitomicaceae bacterium]|nr:FG-GAP-like repeat-containing protein [Crocinitomicaceae bacterium]
MRKIYLTTLCAIAGFSAQAQTFTEITGTPFDDLVTSSIAFADVDNDGDQDVLITGHNGTAPISKLYTNDGSGNFTEVVGTPFEHVYLSSIAFADVDNDGDQDVLITGHNGTAPISKLYTNDGSGNFTEVVTPFDGVAYSSIAFADVDNDGNQDVLITGQNNSYQFVSKLYTNDGSGVFTEELGTPFDGVGESSIAFADVDNDGDQDVLITGSDNSSNPISKLYTNASCALQPQVNLGLDTAICAGTTLTLTAQNTGATYLWSDNSTADTLVVASAGTYSVVRTLSNGCISKDTIVVTVNALPVVNLGLDTAICAGATLTLDAQNAGSTFTWSDNSTAQTLAVTTANTYSIIVEDVNGCIGKDTVEVSINTLPVVNLGLDTAICAGATLTLNAQNAGSTFLWSDNSTAQTLAVTTANTYSVIVEDANGCIGKDTVEVSINTLPAVNLGLDTAICAGNTVTLNAGNAGATFTWSDNSTAQTLAVTTANTYSVIVEDAGGCKGYDTITVAVNALPVVNLGSNITTCSSTFSTVLDAQNAGSTYLWNDGSTNQTLTVSGFGTYSVVVTNANNCSATGTITVSAGSGALTTGNIQATLVSGCTFDFSVANSSSIENFTWNFGTENVQGANVTYTFEDGGSKQVIVYMTNACGSTSKSIVVSCDNTGLDELGNIAFNLYPNPTASTLTVENNGSVVMQQISILNNVGQVVYVVSPNNTTAQLNVSEFANGFYILQIHTEKGIVVKKIEVMK